MVVHTTSRKPAAGNAALGRFSYDRVRRSLRGERDFREQSASRLQVFNTSASPGQRHPEGTFVASMRAPGAATLADPKQAPETLLLPLPES